MSHLQYSKFLSMGVRWLSGLVVILMFSTPLISMKAIASSYFHDNNRSHSLYDKPQLKAMLVEEAQLANIEPALALAVARVESNFDPYALSHAGARGVMQILPSTGESVFGVDADALYDARTNIQLGVAYLRQLLDTYHGRTDIALSHYNGGSRVRQANGELAVIPATRGYVAKVKKWLSRFRQSTDSSTAFSRGVVAERPWRLNKSNHPQQDGSFVVASRQVFGAVRQGRSVAQPGGALDDFSDPTSLVAKKVAQKVAGDFGTARLVSSGSGMTLADVDIQRRAVVKQLRQLQQHNLQRQVKEKPVQVDRPEQQYPVSQSYQRVGGLRIIGPGS